MEKLCDSCNGVFYLPVGYPRTKCFVCKPHPRLPTPSLVVAKYEELESYKKTADSYGVSDTVIEAYIHNFGVSRSRGSCFRFSSVNLNLDWLDGWLLGDGCLHKRQNSMNARAVFCCKYGDYSDYVRENLLKMGLTASRVRRYFERVRGVWGCRFSSRVHPALTIQYNRWYPGGKKVIPIDVRISSVSLREWYLGDGYLQSHRYPILVMGNVLESSVDLMCKRLNGIFGGGVLKRVKSTAALTELGHSRGPIWTLNFTASVARSFFSYIGSCPLSCYQYRWPSSSVEG